MYTYKHALSHTHTYAQPHTCRFIAGWDWSMTTSGVPSGLSSTHAHMQVHRRVGLEYDNTGVYLQADFHTHTQYLFLPVYNIQLYM